jgi:hypothetical protein
MCACVCARARARVRVRARACAGAGVSPATTHDKPPTHDNPPAPTCNPLRNRHLTPRAPCPAAARTAAQAFLLIGNSALGAESTFLSENAGKLKDAFTDAGVPGYLTTKAGQEAERTLKQVRARTTQFH